jgi:imidazole glycerol-phosphate synthase subunit HisH
VTDVLLVDYGAGNLRSLRAAFARIGADARVTADADEAAGARRLVLPGVGAGAPGM